MSIKLREIVINLLDSNLAEMAYYDHSVEDSYHWLDPVNTECELPNYDPEFHKEFEPCIIFAASGEYIGTTADMANRLYIEETYPELIEQGHILYKKEGYGYTAMVIFFLRLSVVRSGLINDLEGLLNYSIFDDVYSSRVQKTLLEEAWGNWVAHYFANEIETRTGFEFENTDWQEQLFWDILSNGDGSEYYPEGAGENIWVDMESVFNDSDLLVETIQEHADLLNTGEYEIKSIWNTVGYRIGYDWLYKGEASHEERIKVLSLHKDYEYGTIPESILKEFGLNWYQDDRLFWQVKPTV